MYELLTRAADVIEIHGLRVGDYQEGVTVAEAVTLVEDITTEHDVPTSLEHLRLYLMALQTPENREEFGEITVDLWAKSLMDRHGPDQAGVRAVFTMRSAARTEQTTLVVDRSSSSCLACGGNADMNELRHYHGGPSGMWSDDSHLGATNGCGALFVKTLNPYSLLDSV